MLRTLFGLKSSAHGLFNKLSPLICRRKIEGGNVHSDNIFSKTEVKDILYWLNMKRENESMFYEIFDPTIISSKIVSFVMKNEIYLGAYVTSAYIPNNFEIPDEITDVKYVKFCSTNPCRNENTKECHPRTVALDLMLNAQSRIDANFAYLTDEHFLSTLGYIPKNVKIRMLVSQNVEQQSDVMLQLLSYSNIELRVAYGSKPYGIMHWKTITVDENISWIGSYNGTYNATNRSWENALVVNSELLVKKIREEQDVMWENEHTKIIRLNTKHKKGFSISKIKK